MALKGRKPSGKKKRKRRVSTPLSRLRNRLDRVLWPRYIKMRDGWRCQRCGRSREAGFKIEAAHVIAKSRSKLLRYDKLNGIALCYQCHEVRWHTKSDGLEWFKAKHPDRWAYLESLEHRRLTTRGVDEVERLQRIAADLEREIARLEAAHGLPAPWRDVEKAKALDAAVEFEDRIGPKVKEA